MDEEEPGSVLGWIWGVLQVAGMVVFLLVVIFGVYRLFQARVHHRFW